MNRFFSFCTQLLSLCKTVVWKHSSFTSWKTVVSPGRNLWHGQRPAALVPAVRRRVCQSQVSVFSEKSSLSSSCWTEVSLPPAARLASPRSLLCFLARCLSTSHTHHYNHIDYPSISPSISLSLSPSHKHTLLLIMERKERKLKKKKRKVCCPMWVEIFCYKRRRMSFAGTHCSPFYLTWSRQQLKGNSGRHSSSTSKKKKKKHEFVLGK